MDHLIPPEIQLLFGILILLVPIISFGMTFFTYRYEKAVFNTGVIATVFGALVALVITTMFLSGGVWGPIYLILLFWIPLVFGNLTLLRSRKTIKPRT